MDVWDAITIRWNQRYELIEGNNKKSTSSSRLFDRLDPGMYEYNRTRERRIITLRIQITFSASTETGLG